jgi:hypothetical protein
MAVLRKYKVLVIPRDARGCSGYVLDAAESTGFPSLEAFAAEAVKSAVTLAPGSGTNSGASVAYTSLAGDRLTMQYRPTGLRADGTINGWPIDWENWANGGVYDSPYLTVKGGEMTVSDGKESYSVRCDGNVPLWRGTPAKPKIKGVG